MVISIIAILMGLLLVGIQKVRIAGKRTVTVTEVNTLGASATKFKQDFGFYPAQSFRIPNRMPDLNNQSDPDTPAMQVIIRMFPRGLYQLGAMKVPLSSVPMNTVLSWGTWSTLPQPITGSQCLVFFLAGPSLQGWDVNEPLNLTPPASGAKRGPYFDFKDSSLKDPTTGTVDYNYRDPFGTPYAYLSTGAGDAYTGGSVSVTTPKGTYAISALSADGKRHANQGTCQIISAGPDQKFGLGSTFISPGNYTPWTPGAGAYATNGDGGDDVGNFNNGLQLSVTP